MSWKVKKHHFSRFLIATAYILALGTYLVVGFQTRPEVEANSDDRLVIPAIDLSTPVKNLTRDHNTLTAPETIPGAYSENLHKTLLIGHSSTIFEDLKDLKIGDRITFDGAAYVINNLETLKKDDIDMRAIIASPTDGTDTLVLMTCAGESIGNRDYTHRLIITAAKQ